MSKLKHLSNHCYDDITLDQSVTVSRTISANDIALFATLSGDLNPVHLDANYAATTAFKKPIAHGMLCGALISATIAMNLPGPGSIYRSQSIKFIQPVFIDDELSIELTVIKKIDKLKLVTITCVVKNQHGKVVANGEAGVIATNEKITAPAAILPEVKVTQQDYVRGK